MYSIFLEPTKQEIQQSLGIKQEVLGLSKVAMYGQYMADKPSKAGQPASSPDSPRSSPGQKTSRSPVGHAAAGADVDSDPNVDVVELVGKLGNLCDVVEPLDIKRRVRNWQLVTGLSGSRPFLCSLVQRGTDL